MPRFFLAASDLSIIKQLNEKHLILQESCRCFPQRLCIWASLVAQMEHHFNKWCWENWSTTCKRMKLEHFLTPFTKINSKWIKNLNIRPETIKFLEDNIGKTLSDINHSKIFYDPPPRILEIKAKINKWDLIKIKNIFKVLKNH